MRHLINEPIKVLISIDNGVSEIIQENKDDQRMIVYPMLVKNSRSYLIDVTPMQTF